MQPQYQMGYDRAITVFSPDGRLYQVEYAREAVKRGTTAVGIKAQGGVVLIVDKRVSSKLLEASSIEKILRSTSISASRPPALSAMHGRSLTGRRIECQINRVSYDERIEVEALAKKLCDHMQTLTQYGGIRPYGTSLLIAGVSDGECRSFETDPSGHSLNTRQPASVSAGRAAMKIFEEEYTASLTIKDAILLGLKALHSATEGKFDVDTVEIGIVECSNAVFKKMTKEEVASYVEQFKQ